MELSAFVAQGAAGSPVDHALACLLGLLGLRVSEACSIDVEDLSLKRGHRTITVLGKGSKLAIIPLPPRVARAVDLAAGERKAGPILLTRAGNRLNRHAATRIVRRLATRLRPGPSAISLSDANTARGRQSTPLPESGATRRRTRKNEDTRGAYPRLCVGSAPSTQPNSPDLPSRSTRANRGRTLGGLRIRSANVYTWTAQLLQRHGSSGRRHEENFE